MLNEVPQPLVLAALTAEQKAQVFGILSVGCDRETAANFIGCSPDDITRAMNADARFAADVRRTEATAELSHMRIIQNEVKEAKNWRAAVWWLERRSPERFASRGAGAVTVRQLRAFLTLLGDGLHGVIHSAEDRDRVQAKLKEWYVVVNDVADGTFDIAANEDTSVEEPAPSREVDDEILADT